MSKESAKMRRFQRDISTTTNQLKRAEDELIAKEAKRKALIDLIKSSEIELKDLERDIKKTGLNNDKTKKALKKLTDQLEALGH